MTAVNTFAMDGSWHQKGCAETCCRGVAIELFAEVPSSQRSIAHAHLNAMLLRTRGMALTTMDAARPTSGGLSVHSCISSVDPDPEVSRLRSAPQWRVAQAERRTLGCLVASCAVGSVGHVVEARCDRSSFRPRG